MGNPWGLAVGVFLSMWVTSAANAQTFTLQRLDSDAPVAEVVASVRPLPWQDNPNGDVIFEQSHRPIWWKLTAAQPFDAASVTVDGRTWIVPRV